MNLLRACLDRRVLAALAVTAVLIAILAPQLITAAIPLLIVAACPLSMVVMMASMRHGDPGGRRTASRGAGEVREELAELAGQQRALASELASFEPAAASARGTTNR